MQGLLYLKGRQLERIGCICDGNTEMKLKEVGWEGMDWITMASEKDK
jgi:hypothetical protein